MAGGWGGRRLPDLWLRDLSHQVEVTFPRTQRMGAPLGPGPAVAHPEEPRSQSVAPLNFELQFMALHLLVGWFAVERESRHRGTSRGVLRCWLASIGSDAGSVSWDPHQARVPLSVVQDHLLPQVGQLVKHPRPYFRPAET